MEETLEGNRVHPGIPFSWGPQIAYLSNLEKRVSFLEQALLNGRTITMKTRDGRKVRVKLTVEQQDVEVPIK